MRVVGRGIGAVMRWCVLVSLMACSPGVFPPDPSDAGEGATPLKRLLYVVHSAGFRHASLEASARALASIGGTRGFSVTVREDAREVLSAEVLSTFDAVAFFTSGDLPVSDAQKEALLSYVRDGGGFAGFHSATDTFYEWPAYVTLAGAWFDGHPWTQQVTVRTVGDDPVLAGVPASWSLHEEVYQYRDFQPDNRVLLELDPSTVDLGAIGVRQRAWGFPLAWVRDFGDGRVFHSGLGHEAARWDEPELQTLVGNGLAWVLRIDLA